MKRIICVAFVATAVIAASITGFPSSSSSLPIGSSEPAADTGATLPGVDLGTLVERGKAIAAGSWNQEYIAHEGLIVPTNADVSKEQVRAVSNLIPPTFDYAAVNRYGTTLVVTAFHEGEGLGLLTVLRTATLADPGALPTSLAPSAYILTEFIPGGSGTRGVVIDPAGNVVQSVALSAAAVPLCCVLGYTAYLAIEIACEAGTTYAPFPAKPVVGSGCLIAGQGIEEVLKKYCNECDLAAVTLDPKQNTGSQVQGNRTQWTLSWVKAADCWSFDVFGPTVEISPGQCGFSVLGGAAAAPYAEFACCISTVRDYTVRGTVYFVDGSVGWADGKVKVAAF